MKYLAVLLAAAFVAGCADQPTSAPQQQPTASTVKNCTPRTGSNLCS